MRFVRQYGLVTIAAIVFLVLMAYGIGAQDIPPVIPNTFVQDHADVMDATDEAAIEAQLREFQQKWNVEFAVATVRTTGQYDKFDYSLKMARTYGIGSKDNEKRGLLLFLAINDRQWQFQISRHMEAVLTDGQSGSIGRNALVPKLKIASKSGKSEDWRAAISDAVAATYTQVQKNIEPEQIAPPVPVDLTPLWITLGILGFLGLAGGGIALVVSHRRSVREALDEQRERSRREAAEEDRRRREAARQAAEREKERQHQLWLKTPEGKEYTRKEAERVEAERKAAEKARREHEIWLTTPEGIADTKRRKEAAAKAAAERRKREKREAEEAEERAARRRRESSSSSSSYSPSYSSSSSSSSSSGGFGGGGDFSGGGSGGSW